MFWGWLWCQVFYFVHYVLLFSCECIFSVGSCVVSLIKNLIWKFVIHVFRTLFANKVLSYHSFQEKPKYCVLETCILQSLPNWSNGNLKDCLSQAKLIFNLNIKNVALLFVLLKVPLFMILNWSHTNRCVLRILYWCCWESPCSCYWTDLIL